MQEFIDENYIEEINQNDQNARSESVFLQEKDLPKSCNNNLSVLGKYTGMRLSGEFKNDAD